MVKSLKKLLVFMRPFLGTIIFAVVLTGALTVIGMAPPLLMRRLINDVAKEGQWGIFPLVMGLLFAVPVLRALISMANNLTLRKVGLGMIANTRKRMYDHLMRLSMRFYNDVPVGSIQQRLMGDIANISNVTTGGMITLFADIVAVAFAVVVMVRLNWKLSLLAFALLPLYYLNFRFFSERIKNANTSRLTGVSAIVRALAGAPDGLDLRRIDATGVRWTLLVRTKLLEDAEILGRSLSQALSSPYSEPIPYPADGTTSYLIRTHYPSEGLGVTPGAPETARAPQGKRDHGTPVREKSLRLDVERLRGQGNTRELVSARDKLSKLRDELVVLEREMLPERGRELRVEAVIDAAEGAGMDAVRFDDDGPVRFHGTTAHRWRVRGVGSLDQVATAVGKVAASGALLGDLTINRVKRADRFRVRMAVYAPRR